ncbi:AIPR family protein [Bradyrhizobium tropiciagri]|uniref:AIPR family protein n=1 Tax=Bradyrhizobium tropiciagri TaxID=312253 RepID=UPI001BA63B9D|nr:AIPR family protein [Bradyrhizobium tropiciagri]MBR0899582.1 AIPR family protein [Bradyrhizobium tropiciagri]
MNELETFFAEVRQEVLAGAAANSDFGLSEFVNLFDRELTGAGAIEGIEFCHYRNPNIGIRVDGFWMNDDAGLDLFIADYESRGRLETLTNTDVGLFFKRISKFYTQCSREPIFRDFDENSPVYGLARTIYEAHEDYGRINLYLLSERRLSDQFKHLEISDRIGDMPIAFHIWDISRLHRLRTSKGGKEPISIDLEEMWGKGILCLPAHLNTAEYHSFLLVMPGRLIADLYSRYGSRLLEQNVRSFLQARAAVNKGIRDTILNDPKMFFAYNNGITATAANVIVKEAEDGLRMTGIEDLQIVNGGQTTASLFHTRRKDKATLDSVFVQMKLSIVSPELSEAVVPKISEFANTQNRVNAADFFSNHPFHIQMEAASRRLWAPAAEGSQRETKWFYERARGQFVDAQAKLTAAETRRFLAEYPKSQMFTKTDLAKYENVWDEHPRFVNLGAQKNFAKYAERISDEWKSDPDGFGDDYYRRAIARAIIFRRAEKIISEQKWYSGGYRANIVAYTIALIGLCIASQQKALDFQKIWQRQGIDPFLYDAISKVGRMVQEDLTSPPEKISNVSEWAKKDACWQRLAARRAEAESLLKPQFAENLLPLSPSNKSVTRASKKVERPLTELES